MENFIITCFQLNNEHVNRVKALNLLLLFYIYKIYILLIFSLFLLRNNKLCNWLF